MTIYAKKRKGPFAVARVGIKGYEDEKQLWKDLPKGCKITFCHIIKRIEVEFARAEEAGWRCGKYQFYPYLFGLTGFETRAQRAFAGRQGSIDIFFIPTRREEDDYTDELPDPKDINWENDDDRSECIEVEGKKYRLPDYIRIGDSEKKYPVLFIDDFECYEKKDSDVLDCSGAYCGGRSSNLSLTKGWRAFDVFENNENNEEYKCADSTYVIVAQAKLIQPYWGWAYPSCSTLDGD